MKKLSPKRFRKIYLLGAFVPLFLSLLLFIIGILLLNEVENTSSFVNNFSIVALILAFVCFLTSIGFIIWGRKRYIHLSQEILTEELNTPIDQLNPISVRWIKINHYDVMKEGDSISFYDEGIKLDHNNLLPWESFKVAEYINGFVALSDEPYQEELWDGIFIVAEPLVIHLLERYLSCQINKERLEHQLLEYKETVDSTIMWHFNWSLLIEKCLFVIIIMLGGIGIGLILVLNFLNQSVSISIANFITIPSLLVGYPKFFNNASKKSFIISKEGFGHAKGRYRIIIPWKDIQLIKKEKRKIKISFHYFSQEGEVCEDSITIPNNKLLVKRFKDYKVRYNLLFGMEEDSI